MTKMQTLGIVGQGFVGSAIREGMRDFEIETFDIDPSKNSTASSLIDLIEKIDEIVFVCLPTPMKKSGKCDTKLVEAVIADINDVANRKGKRIIAVVKSTIPPGTTEKLNRDNEFIDVIFNPEFLTEANSFDDFKNQTRIIIGGPRPASTKVKTMYRRAFPKTPIIKTSSRHAEMVKYFTNCFMSTKVSFANEMYQICKELDLDYDKVVEYALYDDRIGKTHLSVPGPDGHFGFGGHCFPKDLNGLKFVAENLGIDSSILKAVWKKNLEVRKQSDRDWETMVGRAISED